MLHFGMLRDELQGFAADSWHSALEQLWRTRVADGAHGDLPHWQRVLETLPDIGTADPVVDDGAVTVPLTCSPQDSQAIRSALLGLLPWRKGPFRLADVFIDAEWRSDLKWQRLCDALAPLRGRNVLDVGCGNGYYAHRMCDMGALRVVGIDPTLLFVAQFAAIAHFMTPQPVHVLPLRLHELPSGTPDFDTSFSMGVLYHQREPLEHLQQLRDTLRPGGELLLETLILPGDDSSQLVPEGRYARMRNVWHLPSRARLLEWLQDCGFADIRVVDESATTSAEQRTTEWMPFESLREALDGNDPTLTIEGLPAPLRIAVVAQKPPETPPLAARSRDRRPPI